jgi:hypothetical protein
MTMHDAKRDDHMHIQAQVHTQAQWYIQAQVCTHLIHDAVTSSSIRRRRRLRCTGDPRVCGTIEANAQRWRGLTMEATMIHPPPWFTMTYPHHYVRVVPYHYK